MVEGPFHVQNTSNHERRWVENLRAIPAPQEMLDVYTSSRNRKNEILGPEINPPCQEGISDGKSCSSEIEAAWEQASPDP